MSSDAQVATLGSQTRIDPLVEAAVARVGRVTRWTSVGFGAVLVAAAAAGLDTFLEVAGPPGVRPIDLETALGLFLVAVGALLALTLKQSTRGIVVWPRVGVLIGLMSSAYGGYVAVVLVSGVELPIGLVDEMPALSGAVSLFVLGGSVALMVSRFDLGVIVGQVGALLAFSLAGAILLAYAFGDPTLGSLLAGPPLAFEAAAMIVLTASGVFLARPGSGILAVASSPGPGGRLLRRFGPVALLTPALLLLVAESQPASDRIDVLAFVAVGLGLLLLTFLAVLVRTLDEIAVEAATSGARAERAQIGLEQEAPVVAGISEILHVVEVRGDMGWDVAARFRPAIGSVAGDASAVRTLPDGSLGVVLVDVAGHGAGPAVQAVRIRDLLMAAMALGRSPSEALAFVSWGVTDASLASAVVLRVDTESGEGFLASAGHPPALRTGTQTIERIEPTGPLLFLDNTNQYDQRTIYLTPGETIVVFSDGIADVQELTDGKDDIDLLAEMLLAEGGDAERSADLVLGFAQTEPRDDQSVVVLRRQG